MGATRMRIVDEDEDSGQERRLEWSMFYHTMHLQKHHTYLEDKKKAGGGGGEKKKKFY